MAAPLLEFERARVDVGGAAAIDGLSMKTSGDHVLVIGAARALFEAASGMRPAAHGAIFVRGEPAVSALRGGLVAGAPLDPPMPPKWTPRVYATWSARLAGHRRSAAAGLAEDAITRLRMTSVADVPLERAPANLRRTTVIAAALATGAATIFLDDPLSALPDEWARSLARLIATALEDRGWALFTPRLPLASPLALHADEAIVLGGSQVISQGAPAEIAASERSFALTVHGETAAFARMATARGATVAHVSAPSGKVTLDLGQLTTRDLLGIAEETGAIIIELCPLARAFQ